MQRWDDLTPEEQQRYLTAEDLRAQLATATQRAEAAESALRLATGSKGSTQVIMSLEVYEKMLDDHAQLTAATARAETAERERDGFQAWANTLESCAWQDAGFCPHCGADDVRKSVDVLEPDVAKEIRYCYSCDTAWAVKDASQARA